MAAGSAAERAEAGGKKKAAKRGQEVVLTFSMQGEATGQQACFKAVRAAPVALAASLKSNALTRVHSDDAWLSARHIRRLPTLSVVHCIKLFCDLRRLCRESAPMLTYCFCNAFYATSTAEHWTSQAWATLSTLVSCARLFPSTA